MWGLGTSVSAVVHPRQGAAVKDHEACSVVQRFQRFRRLNCTREQASSPSPVRNVERAAISGDGFYHGLFQSEMGIPHCWITSQACSPPWIPITSETDHLLLTSPKMWATVNQHPPAHHPLDAYQHSIVDEPQLS
jgi:hypothetical protein